MVWLKSQRPFLTIILGCCFFVAGSTPAWAAPELNLPATTDLQPVELPSMFWLFIKMVFSLVIIAGLAYLMVRVLKKNLRPPATGEWINIIDQYPLGMNKGVFLAEIAGKAYILGVTDHNINILGEFEDQDRLEEIKRQLEIRDQLPPAAQNLWTALLDLFKKGGSKNPGDFHAHILKQIHRLQTMSKDPSKPSGKGDGSNG